MGSRDLDSLPLVLLLFSQAESGPEPLEQRLACPNFPTRGFCSPPKCSCLMPHLRILVDKGKWAFTLGQAPSRKHCQDVSGIGLSGKVTYLINSYVFV